MQTELNLQAIIASDPPYMAGGVLRLSTIDYPGRLASVIYCSGCPLRCPYCHNKGLVLGQTVELPMIQAAGWHLLSLTMFLMTLPPESEPSSRRKRWKRPTGLRERRRW